MGRILVLQGLVDHGEGSRIDPGCDGSCWRVLNRAVTNLFSQGPHILKQGFLTLVLLTFGPSNSLLCAALGITGCLVPSLTSTH